MANTQTIYIDDHELIEMLESAVRTGSVLRLQSSDKAYEINVRSAESRRLVWEGYDPEAIREALYATAGTASEIDAEALIRQIKAERE